MGAQAVLQRLIRVVDGGGDVHGFVVVVFQDIVNGGLGDNALVIQRARLALAQHDGGHAEDGLFKNVLIVLFALSDLFVKPSHSCHLLSRWI